MAQYFTSGPCSAQLNAIHRISSALFAQADVDAMLLETLEVSMQTAEAEAGSILLYDRSARQLVFRHALGPDANGLVGRSVNLEGCGRCATVFKTGASDISIEGFDPPEGKPAPTSTLTTAIRNFGGEPIGVVQVLNKRGGVFDNRDKELLEIVSAMAATVIDNAQRAEERKQAALARILAHLGHDLKNQTLIIESAFKTETDFCRFKAVVAAANSKASRLAFAMNEYAKGKDLFDFKPNDLAAALKEELAQLVMLAPKFEHGLDLSGIAPVPVFRFDQVFVSRAVYNLVENAGGAIFRSKRGNTVRVFTDHVPDGVFPDGNYVEIRVEDNGPGIAPAKLGSILSGQAEPDPDKPGSTGIGTRIVHDVIVVTHGGQFVGESVLGKGTIFRLRLPLGR